ncbi:MAG: polymer-forming cytoskeletal protein [Lachnospiraceae bacterium]|nr:polymer-forming cytoskeletal protein [Lachnospiraceae bacterium]
MFGFTKERDDKINLNNYTITTIVGADTVVEGTIITKSSVRIDGTLIGGVSAEGVVILSKNGKIKGNIMAENIVVAGVVEGNMQIREKVNVEPTGEIYGDITTKSLLIDEESVFQGNCYMNREIPENGGRGKRKAAKSEKIVAASEAATAAMGRMENVRSQNGPSVDLNMDEEISLRPAPPLDDDDIDLVDLN